MEWKILNIEALQSYSSLTNVIESYYWMVTHTKDNGDYASAFGKHVVDISATNPETFVSWSGVTHAQALQWLHNDLNRDELWETSVSSIEAYIRNQADSGQKNTILTGTPWSDE